MRYSIDCEFLEGTQTKGFLGFNIGQTKPTIDLISIALVAGDGREFYAISKDFNLKEAWNRWQWKDEGNGVGIRIGALPKFTKEYWIRENVLKPIFDEFYIDAFDCSMPTFNYKSMERLINKIGKTNKQIAEEVKEFCLDNVQVYKSPDGKYVGGIDPYKGTPEFYGYFADYDWVAFCWLFGKMIDLPTGFPKYCIDLKQELDRIQKFYVDRYKAGNLKDFTNYPKQTNEHNALADARWNKQLYDFLQEL